MRNTIINEGPRWTIYQTGLEIGSIIRNDSAAFPYVVTLRNSDKTYKQTSLKAAKKFSREADVI